MGRTSWATQEQNQWLSARKKAFSDAQAAETTRAFFAATTEAFLKSWPLDDPTTDEIAHCDGNRDGAIRAKIAKLKDRIAWWFRNRARPSASGGRGKGGLIAIGKPQRRNILAYQAYMHLYSERVMPVISQEYDKYKAKTTDAEPKGLWAFTMDEARRMLAQEPDDVRAAVEVYRKESSQDSGLVAIEPHALLDKGLVEAQKLLRDVQTNINHLSRTGENTLKKVEELTGFKGIMLIGGPHPETGRLVTLAIQNGRTLTLGNVFLQACENWPVVQTSFEQFIASCFPVELPGQLEALYRGEDPFQDSDAPKAGVNPTATGMNVTSAAAVSIAATAPLPITSPSTPIAPTPSTATAPLPAAPLPAASPSTSSTSASQAPKVTAPREKTYDELRTEQIAKNQRHMALIMAGKSAEECMKDDLMGECQAGNDSADEDLIDMDGGEDSEGDSAAPGWASEGKALFREVSSSAFWIDLLGAWWALEQALDFKAAQLPTKYRPEEIGVWIKHGRKASPTIKSLPNYVAAWKKWWTKMQPPCRLSEDAAWPLLRVVPEDPHGWDNVRKSGSNGIFMVVMSLAWWVQAPDADPVEVVDAVHDVTWAFNAMAGESL